MEGVLASRGGLCATHARRLRRVESSYGGQAGVQGVMPGLEEEEKQGGGGASFPKLELS